MTTRSKYFGQTTGGFSIYVDGVENHVRFCLAHYGEDANLVLKHFWREHPDASFLILPLFSYGSAPRVELCTQQSLAAALQSVTLEPDSLVEKAWKEAAEELNVAWPVRLSRYTRSPRSQDAA